jgi:hypothetical protein
MDRETLIYELDRWWRRLSFSNNRILIHDRKELARLLQDVKRELKEKRHG